MTPSKPIPLVRSVPGKYVSPCRITCQSVMTCKVVFSPEAEEQLVELYHYIADVASRDIAARYTDAESQKGIEDRPS